MRFIASLDYDPASMHGDDPDAIAWFMSDVLCGELILHSNELGDEVGHIDIERILGDPLTPHPDTVRLEKLAKDMGPLGRLNNWMYQQFRNKTAPTLDDLRSYIDGLEP